MILYHYTKPEVAESITRDGLIPGLTIKEDDVVSQLVGQPVVWLTTAATTVLPEGDREFLGERTFLPQQYSFRFTVRIPTTDRRLVHFTTWIKRNDPSLALLCDCPLFRTETIRKFWMYFGVIRPEKIVEVCPKA